MSSEYNLNPPTVSLFSEKLLLKILCEHNGFNHFFRSHGWSDDTLAYALGLNNEWDNQESISSVKLLLQKRYQEIKKCPFSVPSELEIAYQNINKLTQYIELNEVEKAIFTLVFHLKHEEIIENGFNFLGSVNITSAIGWISKLCSLDKSAVKLALAKNQKLKTYGLIEQSRHNTDLEGYLEWGDTLDFDEFLNEPLTEKSLLARCLIPAAEPHLTLADFEHIQSMQQMMLNYLRQAVDTHKKGVNILLHGLPGTGKTEFATLLGKLLQIDTYMLHFSDSDGETLNAKTRLNSCVLAQKLLTDRSSMIIFDEIEDVFSAGLFERSVAQSNKAWVNHFLENNNVPMIWISNDINSMDNAYLRRFDIIFEMPDLPYKQKEHLIRNLAGEQLSESYIQHFAKIPALSPAILERTLKVVTSLKLNSQVAFAEQTRTLFNQTLQAQGFKKIEPLTESLQADYSLDFVSCKADIYKISKGLKQTKCGRICCYGVPGTGKTAWAKWLAQELEMQPLVLQGSDLLDMYVGGTEQKIAAAFERARNENMLLILDEVDSFLFTRQSGQRSWEHSQVNEMLTQIEKFEGLMVVSTNLLDELDPAALRRFDLKLQFDYLKPQQSVALAKVQAAKFELNFTENVQQKIERLPMLTQGDFAAVARRHRFAPFENENEWIDALEDECRLKQGKVPRRIGF